MHPHTGRPNNRHDYERADNGKDEGAEPPLSFGYACLPGVVSRTKALRATERLDSRTHGRVALLKVQTAPHVSPVDLLASP